MISGILADFEIFLVPIVMATSIVFNHFADFLITRSTREKIRKRFFRDRKGKKIKRYLLYESTCEICRFYTFNFVD